MAFLTSKSWPLTPCRRGPTVWTSWRSSQPALRVRPKGGSHWAEARHFITAHFPTCHALHVLPQLGALLHPHAPLGHLSPSGDMTPPSGSQPLPPHWEVPTGLVSGCSCLPALEVPSPTTQQIQPALWDHPAVGQPHGSWWLHRLVCPSATTCLDPSTSRRVPTTSPTANRISLLDTKHHCQHPGENVPAGTAQWDELGLIHGAAGTQLQGQPQAAPPAPPWSSVQGCGAQAPGSPTGLHPSLPSVLTQGSSLGAHTLPRRAATFRHPPFLPQVRQVLGLDWGARDDTTGVKPAAPTGTG